MFRTAALIYGLVCYAMFLGVYLYAIGFMGNFGVPKAIDSGPDGPLAQAILINLLLLGVFAIPHSVMARPTFKRWWTKMVPEPIERSTYVLVSNLALTLLFWQWRPMGGVIWNVENSIGRLILWGLFGLGWLLVLLSTLQINHLDLFGIARCGCSSAAGRTRPSSWRPRCSTGTSATRCTWAGSPRSGRRPR